MSKVTVITLRATVEEKAALQEAAKASGMTLTAYVMRRCLTPLSNQGDEPLGSEPIEPLPPEAVVLQLPKLENGCKQCERNQRVGRSVPCEGCR